MAEGTETVQEEVVNIDQDFQGLHKDVSEQMERFSMLARDAPDDASRKLFLEMGNTCLGMLRDTIAAAGRAFQVIEDELEETEEAVEAGAATGGSQLTAEDADEFKKVLTSNVRLITELLPSATGEQKKGLSSLKSLTEDLVKYVDEITVGPGDDEEDDEDDLEDDDEEDGDDDEAAAATG